MTARAVTSAAAALLGAGAFAAQGDGAVSARLDGRFEVTVKVTASSFPASRAPQSRVFRFEPLCKAGACRKVRLDRETRRGTFVRSELHRVTPGVYEGVEVQRKITCRGGLKGPARTVRIHLEILGSERGKATDIKGRLFAQTQGCPEEETQRLRFAGHS